MKNKKALKQFQEFDDDDNDLQFAVEKRAEAASKSTWVSIVVNLFLSLLQIIVGVFARSTALIADGVHSLSDLVADFVVLYANKKSQEEADDEHPYGHQRFETAASLILGLLLIAVGIGMLWAAFVKINHRDAIPTVTVFALWVAIGTLIAKEALFRYMLTIAKKVKSSMLVANAWHARSDAASSLVVALGIFGNMQGYPLLDPIAALIVGIMICKTGWKFSATALRDLIDHSVDEKAIKDIHATLLSTQGVLGVHDLRTRKMGDMISVDAHIEVKAELTVEEGHNIAVIARVNLIKAHQVLSVLLHVDPAHRADLDHS